MTQDIDELPQTIAQTVFDFILNMLSVYVRSVPAIYRNGA